MSEPTPVPLPTPVTPPASSPGPRDTGTRAALWIGLLSLVVLLVSILRSGPELIYDEPMHLETAQRLEQLGFTVEFLRGATLSSPGPLYAVTHTILRPLTHWHPPALRLVNFGFLLLTMALLGKALRLQGSPRAAAISLCLLAAPTMWVISGLALTEMPAMTCAMIGSVCLLRVTRPGERGRLETGTLAVIGGLAAGLAVTGRQPYLAVLLAAPALADRRNWRSVLLFLLAGAILPSLLFSVWGGISPPRLTAVTRGISILHGVLALAYGGAMMAIFSLRWFSLGWKWSAGAVAVALASNAAFGFVQFSPAFSVARKILPAAVLPLYGHLAGGVLLALAGLFALSSLKNLWAHRDDRTFVFAGVCAGLLCLTAMKVTVQFSSRYVAVAMPWLLLCADRYWEAGWGKTGRMILGHAIGWLMLMSYFDSHE